MSADILDMPARSIRPDERAVFDVIDTVDPADIGALVDLALFTLQRASAARGDPGPTRTEMQGLVNLLAIACFSLALAIGIPRGDITLPPQNEGA